MEQRIDTTVERLEELSPRVLTSTEIAPVERVLPHACENQRRTRSGFGSVYRQRTEEPTRSTK